MMKRILRMAVLTVLNCGLLGFAFAQKNLNTKSGNNQSILATDDAGIRTVDPSNGYTMWSKYQSIPVSFNGNLVNFGTNDITDASVKIEITDQNQNLVYTDSADYSNILAGDSIGFSVGSYTGLTLGNFTVKCYSTLTGLNDLDNSNDTVYTYFQITDSTIARDYSIFTGVDGFESTYNYNANESKLGNKFTITKDDYLTSVYFELVSPQVSGDSIRASIYSVDANNLPDSLIAQTVIAHIDQPGVADTFNLAIENGPFALAPGTYVVCVNEYQGRINLGVTNRIWSPASSVYYFNRPQNGLVGWINIEGFGIKQSFVVRPQFGCALNAQFTATDETCLNSNGSLSAIVDGAKGNVSYLWSNGETTSSIANLPAGNYFCNISDESGCNQFIIANVFNIPGPIVSGNISDVTCFGLTNGTATAVVNGGTGSMSYLWSTGDTNDNVSNLIIGTYTVTVTDQNGCTNSVDLIINQPDELTSSISSIDISCNGYDNGSITVTPAGGVLPYSYNWSNGSTTDTINNLVANNYFVLVTDANGCTVVDQTNINEPSIITSSITGTNVTCFGDADATANAIGLGGTGALTYNWSNGTSGNSLSQISGGVYTVVITDANLCMHTDSISIFEPSALVSVLTATDITCNGFNNGTISTLTTGGVTPYSYFWSNTETTSDISNLAANTYSVVIADTNGCTFSDQATINEPPAIVVFVSGNNVLCNGQTNGSAIVVATGGVGSLGFLWSTGATTDTINTLAAAVYSVTVTDATLCTATQTLTIVEPGAIVNVFTTTPDNGTSNGTATTTPQGGFPPFTYQWQTIPVQTTQSITGLAAGIYFVITTDANGCSQTDAVQVFSTVGLNEVTAGITLLNIFPVPATTILNIDLQLEHPSKIQIEMYNTAGQIVYSKGENSSLVFSHQIAVNTIEKGIYMLRIVTDQGMISKRIVVQ